MNNSLQQKADILQDRYGLKTATGETPVAPQGKTINVSVHKDAAEWEPVSVKVAHTSSSSSSTK